MATMLGYDKSDLTGPTAATGPDGIQDLHIQVTNLPIDFKSDGTPLATLVDNVSITGPTGFSWSYKAYPAPGVNNPQAGPSVQVVLERVTASSTGETADIYINPVVQVIDPGTGQVTDQTIPSNSNLSLSVTYTPGADTNANTQLTFTSNSLSSGASSPAPADAKPSLPTLGLGTYPATFGAQVTDTGLVTTGYASVTLSKLPINSTLSSVTLSDSAGQYWTLGATHGRPELGIPTSPSILTYKNEQNKTRTAQFYFPPERDEAGATMTVAFQLTGDSTQYVSDFAVPAAGYTDPTLRDQDKVIPSGATTIFAVLGIAAMARRRP